MITLTLTLSGLALFFGQIGFIESRRWWVNHDADFDRVLGTCNAVFRSVRDYGITPEVGRGKVIFGNASLAS